MTTETTTTTCTGDPCHLHGWAFEGGRWRQACGCRPAAAPPCPEPRRFLCVCQYGHSRSVALCRVLHGLGLQAVACGFATAPDALPALAAWADVVALLTPEAAPLIPAAHRHKVADFNVGPDRWSNPYHPELRAILASMVADFFRPRDPEVKP
jgi:hypothetical protein